MGIKFSFLDRESSFTGQEASSDGRGIEAPESRAETSVIEPEAAIPQRQCFEPPGYGPPGYVAYPNYGPMSAYGVVSPYEQPLYGMDYINNAVFSPYDIPGLPQETYDEDDVFMRPPGYVPAAYHGQLLPGVYQYQGIPPGALSQGVLVPRGDTMRYVQCLTDGVLAVWGDERNPNFPHQFSKSGMLS